MDSNSASDIQLTTWLVDSAGNVAVSDAGMAIMLDAQITQLEDQCCAVRESRQLEGTAAIS